VTLTIPEFNVNAVPIRSPPPWFASARATGATRTSVELAWRSRAWWRPSRARVDARLGDPEGDPKTMLRKCRRATILKCSMSARS
jgi:hypothetical protein